MSETRTDTHIFRNGQSNEWVSDNPHNPHRTHPPHETLSHRTLTPMSPPTSPTQKRPYTDKHGRDEDGWLKNRHTGDGLTYRNGVSTIIISPIDRCIIMGRRSLPRAEEENNFS
jgi:hypothetical protein